MAFSLERHLLWVRSHTVFCGQQCRWSEQQMAWVRAGWVFGISSLPGSGSSQADSRHYPKSTTRRWNESRAVRLPAASQPAPPPEVTAR